jgi:hypothetical protein
MPKHNVYFSLPTRELGNTDIIIEVYGDEERIGKLTISKGAIEWYPANAKLPYKMDWTQFDRVIKSH